jgi:hypothetical protein
MYAVGNDPQHYHHCREQPYDQPDVLPRASDVVVGATAILVLLSVRDDGDQDNHAETDHREHGASPEVRLGRYNGEMRG